MTVYLEPDSYRKPTTERRTGVDRRHPLTATHMGVERRMRGERRAMFDRRAKASLSNTKVKAKPGLFGFLFKNRLTKAKDRKDKRRRSPNDGSNIHLEAPFPRAHERKPCEIPVKIFDRDTYKFVPATVHNFSQAGMYLESEYAPRVGSGLTIRMINHSAEAADPEDVAKYHSQVKWRNKVSGNVVFLRYGIGVRHCIDLEEFLRLFSF